MPYTSFVSRQDELTKLRDTLNQALQGHGQVIFVTGDAGSGKSTLLREFCRLAQAEQEDLIVAFGQSDAETGISDPNLIFREILAQLAGDLNNDTSQTTLTGDNVSRIQSLFNLTIQALVDVGPDLIGVFLPGAGILAKVGVFAADKTGLRDKLGNLIKHTSDAVPAGQSDLEQEHIFEQYTRVLQVMTKQRPLLLILDDLQWADQASISLLFHLGRRITQNRILIVGTYRPEEVGLGRRSQSTGQVERHPLEKVLSEFKRYYGDVNIDLNQSAQSDGLHFVNSLLDTEPNALGKAFRQALYDHTRGNPLFIVELIREMQERGDLCKDSQGHWIENKGINWSSLPARIEGVIQERIGRLDDESRELLNIASVEGELFTAEVVAEVQQEEYRSIIRLFSRELVKRHQLITGQGIQRLSSSQRLSLYKFNHKLLQTYLYNNLDEVQRIIVHEDIGTYLEQLYADKLNDITIQLAHHFVQAGLEEKALYYLQSAGELAVAQYAYLDAIEYFTRALQMLPSQTDALTIYELLSLREHAYNIIGNRESQPHDIAQLATLAQQLDSEKPNSGLSYRAEVYLKQAALAEVTGDYETIITVAQRAIELAHQVAHTSAESRGYLLWGQALWRTGAYAEAKEKLLFALNLSNHPELQHTHAGTLRNLGIATARLGDYTQADLYLLEALTIYHDCGDRQGQTGTYNAMGVFAAEQGDFDKARAYFEESLAVYREIGDRWGEGAALSNLGQVCAERCEYEDTRQYLEQALEICSQIGDLQGEGTILNNLGQMANEQGDYGAALQHLHKAVVIMQEIGDKRVQGIAIANLGLVHLHIGDLDGAGRHLDDALTVLHTIDYPLGQSLVLTYQALRMHYMDENDSSRKNSETALSIAEKIGDRAAQAYALTILGHALTELDDFQTAGEVYQKALIIREALGQPNLASEIQAGLANLALVTGELPQAKAYVDTILDYLKTGNMVGTLEPLRILLTCVLVLHALGDARMAEILENVDLLLHRQAYRIQDIDLEKVFFSSRYANEIQRLKQSL